MRTELKAVIFDFGGVFTDSPFLAVSAYGQSIGASMKQVSDIVFGGYGSDGSHPWHRVERGEITLEQTRDDILALGREQGLEVDIWDVFKAMADAGGGLRHNLVDYIPLIRDAGLQTGIITNNIIEFSEHWRAMFAVEEMFDFIVDSCEVGIRKPDPAIFEHALELADLAPKQALFLDDFAGNIEAARALGMHCQLVDGDGAKTIRDLDAVLGLQ